jgi:hypothetical protein
MKHIKTFESFNNEQIKINESLDIDGFIDALKNEVETKGAHFYMDDSDDDAYVFAVSKAALSDSDIKKMFDTGKPVTGAKMFYIDSDNVDTVNIEKELKASGLNINYKPLIQAYLNEGNLNEARVGSDDYSMDSINVTISKLNGGVFVTDKGLSVYFGNGKSTLKFDTPPALEGMELLDDTNKKLSEEVWDAVIKEFEALDKKLPSVVEKVIKNFKP